MDTLNDKQIFYSMCTIQLQLISALTTSLLMGGGRKEMGEFRRLAQGLHSEGFEKTRDGYHITATHSFQLKVTPSWNFTNEPALNQRSSTTSENVVPCGSVGIPGDKSPTKGERPHK